MIKDYLYFPGCTVKNFDRNMDKLIKKVCLLLDINLIKVPEFSCCGKNTLCDSNDFLSYLVSARNLAYADKIGFDIITPCSVCYNTLRKARADLISDSLLRKRINCHLEKIGLEFIGKSDVKTFLHALAIDMELKFETHSPLKHFTVGCFYGCQTIRPNNKLGNFNERDCNVFEMLLEKTGANVVNYQNKFSCCGYHVLDFDKKMSENMIDSCIILAKENKIDFLITPCIYCKLAFDNAKNNAKKDQKDIVPMIHLIQFLGLSLGIKKEDCGIE